MSHRNPRLETLAFCLRSQLPRRLAAFLFAVSFAAVLGGPAAGAEAAAVSDPPNIVLIFIDDMGYGDVGFNGAEAPHTPNLDQMAKEGMRFTDFYVGCPVCSGSRTALLTGCHYPRLSMAAVLFPKSDRGLHPDEVTIADMLKTVGYKTMCIGKWHLGHLPPCLPTYQGFDSYYGIPYSNDMWIDPANKIAEDCVFRKGLSPEDIKPGRKVHNDVPLMQDEEIIEYPTDQDLITKKYTDEALTFIEANKDGPFFLYLPHTMVHKPLHVSEQFQKEGKKPADSAGKSPGINDGLIQQAIAEVDWSVGQIAKKVKELGIEKETLIIFTSDNGAAVGSSLPLREKKGSVYDGGIREPTLMWWPGKIPAGTDCREVAATIDILPTLAHITGAKLPERKIDGKNIWPLMAGEEGAKSPHEAYILLHGPGCVRSGKWKFYPWRERKKSHWDRGKPLPGAFPAQLYDIVADISERNNVAEAHPEVVKRLQAAYDAHAAEIQKNRRPTAEMRR